MPTLYPASIRIGEVIKDELAARGMTQEDFGRLVRPLAAKRSPGKALDKPGQTATKWLGGYKMFDYDLVAEIEEVLGLRRGELGFRAGFCLREMSTRDVIEADPHIAPPIKALILNTLNDMAAYSKSERDRIAGHQQGTD